VQLHKKGKDVRTVADATIPLSCVIPGLLLVNSFKPDSPV